MDETQRRLPDCQHQFVALFQHYICSTGDQVVAVARIYCCKSPHATRHNDHSIHAKGTAGYWRRHVIVVVDMLGRGPEIRDCVVGFVFEGGLGPFADDQMRLHVEQAECDKCFDAEYGSCCAGQSDNDPHIIYKVNKAMKNPPLPPTERPTGPVKENKIFGDDIDLGALPVPFLRGDDGGKFLQTFGMHIVQTPNGDWVNWSITRGMIHDQRSLVGPIIPKQDIGVIWQMWKDRETDMPWALCFGVPPAAITVGDMPIPKWTNEAGFIGALSGSPIEVVKCETNELRVPANAEIVL